MFRHGISARLTKYIQVTVIHSTPLLNLYNLLDKKTKVIHKNGIRFRFCPGLQFYIYILRDTELVA